MSQPKPVDWTPMQIKKPYFGLFSASIDADITFESISMVRVHTPCAKTIVLHGQMLYENVPRRSEAISLVGQDFTVILGKIRPFATTPPGHS